ncbi:MAG: ABC transporter substrate-binding protein [Firmicutes bacterium]|nr:ABC transporter substrate-binding protein [Bacillota bacterium]
MRKRSAARGRLAAAALLAAGVLLLTACGGGGGGQAGGAGGGSETGGGGDVIKIGADFNLTGSVSSLDVPAFRGAQLAAEEVNAKGGVLGKKIQLISYDGKSDPATVANITTQMIENDKVVAITGFTDTDSALAAGPIAQAAGIPFLTTGATSPKLPDQVGDFMFLVPFGDNVQAAAMAEFAYKELHAKTAYLLLNNGYEYTHLLAQYFKDRFTQLAGPNSILLEDTYEASDTDYSAQIAKFKALPQKPDFLFISAYPDEVGSVVKQFREAGVTLPILGGDGYDTPLLTQVAGEKADEVYFSTHSYMDPQNGTPAIKAFMEAYKKKYGDYPENAFAAMGYDSVNLLVDAIQRANSTDPKAIRDALAQTKGFQAISGEITYPEGKRVPQKAVTIIHVVKGKLTLAKQWVPEVVPAP